jgi:SAM-dependent methyltransferase
VLETLKSAARIVADYRFDLKYGTDTMRQVAVDSLGTNSGNKAHARRYQASKSRALLKLFRMLALPSDNVFVDMGCGKGRVLLLASQYGFRRVVGIEFSAPLCRKAEENIAAYFKRNPLNTIIEVIEKDITLYEFKEDESVFFLYNPFDSVVLGQTLDNLGKSVSAAPREIRLIYNFPEEHKTVHEHWLFPTYKRYEIEGEVFHVYEHHAGR